MVGASSRGLALLALGFATGCGWGAPKSLPAGDPGQPDIILVSIDTLRADHLSAYGHDRETSPFMDQLAKDGVRFSFARSASPWTLPSHTTLFSGQLPKTHKIVEDSFQLDRAVPVLPERMQSAGYTTAGFVSTFYVSSKFGFDRGFDHFDDFGIHDPKVNLKATVDMSDVVDATLTWWADQRPGQPVFLFLHTYDVHYEYDPPGEYATLFDRAPNSSDRPYKNYFHFLKKPLDEAQYDHQRAQYDEAIRYVDDQLKRISVAAKAAGRDVRFVITSDHGEEFGERGAWGHAHTLYAEQLHVPLIMSGGGLPAGLVVDGAVGTQDIAPTLAAMANQPPMTADGLNLAPAIGGAALPERAFTAETTRFKTNRLGLYAGGLRLEWDVKSNTAELFDPHADPKETHDLAEARPLDVDRLQKLLLADVGEPWTAKVAGSVRTKGVAFRAGHRWGHRMRVEAGDTFLVLPYDAEVRFEVDDQKVGPWQGMGGQQPGEGDPLAWLGSATSIVEMNDAERQMLIELGYIQDDDGQDDDGQDDAEPSEDDAAQDDGAPGAGEPKDDGRDCSAYDPAVPDTLPARCRAATPPPGDTKDPQDAP